MKVNLDETKDTGFRNGGKTVDKESFYYLGQKIDIDPYYRYLDIIFEKRMVKSSCHTSSPSGQSLDLNKTVYMEICTF